MNAGPLQKLDEAKALTVMKFGGAALATPERVMRAAKRIAGQIRRGNQAIVVVSAMGDETDRLLELTRQVQPAVTSHSEIDAILCAGEQIAAGLMALCLQAQGIRARSFLAHQVPIIAAGMPGDAEIVRVGGANLLDALKLGITPVVAGFQGVEALGSRLLTLGRGGSDTTAVAIAATVGADSCEFFKDVDGVHSADPASQRPTTRFDYLTYEEMGLLVENGAEVLHAKAIRMAARLRVPLHVRSAFLEGEGTRIGLGLGLDFGLNFENENEQKEVLV